MSRSLPMVRHFLRHRFHALRPFDVQAVLTNACNLSCHYCRCPETVTTQLSAAVWGDLIRRLAAAGTWRIKFQGGEPTLRRDFGEICRAAREAGIVTAVMTNGFGIARDPRLLDALDEVVVSLDALRPELHDRHRGAGAHATAMRALELARGRGCKTYVNMVVHRENIEELEPVLAFCQERGLRLNAQAAMFDHAYQNPEASFLALPEERERALYRQLATWKRAGRPLLFSAASFEHAGAWPDLGARTRTGRGRSRCMAGREYLHVEPDGNVHPCGLHGGGFRPLNAVRDGFEAALRHAQSHDCEDCGYAYLHERRELFGLRTGAILELLRRG